ncbi:hypothetical protein NDU88_002603 [Pleurodeles waltl]|uniref:Secreted protein n=1 Tax=Pleurodeles waltl TaxID=8319 RepID=A0AAV7VDS1_PLEWA|nr:hypothetical protein NDU88_002603 [Pleurodeles waltl]
MPRRRAPQLRSAAVWCLCCGGEHGVISCGSESGDRTCEGGAPGLRGPARMKEIWWTLSGAWDPVNDMEGSGPHMASHLGMLGWRRP